MKLNLGCGMTTPQGWINVDYAVGARIAKVPLVGKMFSRALSHDWDKPIVLQDLRKPLPWPDGSADCVYSSHTLEHLTRANGERLMSEIARVLSPDGIVRIVVPDLRVAVNRYIDNTCDARDMMKALGAVDCKEASIAQRFYALLSGTGHRCMYDDASLAALMTDVGLDIWPAAPLEGRMSNLEEVERPDRARNSVIIEGRR